MVQLCAAVLSQHYDHDAEVCEPICGQHRVRGQEFTL